MLSGCLSVLAIYPYLVVKNLINICEWVYEVRDDGSRHDGPITYLLIKAHGWMHSTGERVITGSRLANGTSSLMTK